MLFQRVMPELISEYTTLSAAEDEAYDTLKAKKKLYREDFPGRIQYFKPDNFTVCLVEFEDGEKRVGVSKRNCTDRPNPFKGKMIAFTRSITR